jgi:uncharacterized membrane protein YidH (DUF202 family)
MSSVPECLDEASPPLQKERDLSGDETETDAVAINEAQLVLAEKRTSLAEIRTGIAVLALPLSILSVLVATSKYYDVVHVLHFLIPLVGLVFILIVFGGYLIVRAVIRLRHYDRLIHQIKLRHSIIGQFID